MPDDKAAQVILTKRGDAYCIRDRKKAGQKTIVDPEEFYSETTFDTLEDAYEFCRKYDPDYMGNYLFGNLELDQESDKWIFSNKEAIQAESGSSVSLDTELVIPEEYSATYNWFHEGAPLEENASVLVIQELTETNAGLYTVKIDIVADYNRHALKIFEFIVTLDESDA